MNGQHQADFRIGSLVEIVQKADQTTGKLTKGEVLKILTKKEYHSRGIKVQLKTGEIGRVQNVLN